MTMQATFVLTGCSNRPRPDGRQVSGAGVSVLRLDPATGVLTPLHVRDRIDNPTFVAIGPDQRTLYVTTEVESWDEGLVSAYTLDPATGALRYLNKQPSRGAATAYLSVHPSGRWLFAANYLVVTAAVRPAQALVVFPIEPDGGLGPVAASVAHAGAGCGVVAGRQDAPHPHCAVPSPDGRFVLVADLGLDRICVYPFDAQRGALGAARPLALSPGCGPRHLAFCADGRFVLVVGELDNSVRLLAWDAADGALRQVASVPALPPGWQGVATGADIAVSADGGFAYVSSRGADTVVTLAVDAAAATLRVLGHDAAPAKPRSLAVAGAFLLVAGQDAGSLAVFRRDAASGRLTATDRRAAIGSPTCVRIAQPPAS